MASDYRPVMIPDLRQDTRGGSEELDATTSQHTDLHNASSLCFKGIEKIIHCGLCRWSSPEHTVAPESTPMYCPLPLLRLAVSFLTLERCVAFSSPVVGARSP